MYEQQIKLKPDNPSSRFAKRRISPAFGWHAWLFSLILNNGSLVFVFRSGKSIVFPRNSMLIGRVFCPLLAVCFVDFDFFSAIFICWIIMEIRNAPYRRLQINGGLWTGRSWTTPINSPHTSWKLPLQYLRVTITWNNGVNLLEPVRLLIAIASQCWRLWSRCLLFFPKNVFIIECQFQTDGVCP